MTATLLVGKLENVSCSNTWTVKLAHAQGNAMQARTIRERGP